MKYKILLLLTLYAMSSISQLIQDQFDFATPLYDWILQGHLIQALNRTTLVHCVMLCSEIWNCYSINFYPSKGVCELNSAINASNPEDLQYHVNGVYLLNLYRRMPCSDSHCGSEGSRCFYDKGIKEECIACSLALGLQDRSVIPDNAIHASSQYQGMKLKQHARLHFEGGWVARYDRQGEWVRVDLGKIVFVTKIATQGDHGNNANYIKKYTIDKSFDRQHWEVYKEQGSVKVFYGNGDHNSVVINIFKEKFPTKYVRLVVEDFAGFPALRMELYGCDPQ